MSQTSNEIRNIVDNWVDEKISNIHTALNGKIISYDASINRAIKQKIIESLHILLFIMFR